MTNRLGGKSTIRSAAPYTSFKFWWKTCPTHTTSSNLYLPFLFIIFCPHKFCQISANFEIANLTWSWCTLLKTPTQRCIPERLWQRNVHRSSWMGGLWKVIARTVNELVIRFQVPAFRGPTSLFLLYIILPQYICKNILRSSYELNLSFWNPRERYVGPQGWESAKARFQRAFLSFLVVKIDEISLPWPWVKWYLLLVMISTTLYYSFERQRVGGRVLHTHRQLNL